MLVVAILIAACTGVLAVDPPPLPQKIHFDLTHPTKLFEEFKRKHKKKYHNALEHAERFQIFRRSLEKINELNSISPHAVFELNNFSDWRPEELEQLRGLKPLNESEIEWVEPPMDGFVDLPPSFDWRDQNVVSPVKSQWECLSCYVFSAIGNIEGQYALKYQECLSLSEQQIIDCLPEAGCETGWPHVIMNSLAQHHMACDLESQYPTYRGQKYHCRMTVEGTVSVLGGKVLAIRDETTLMQALVEIGPLAVTLSHKDLVSYQGGIIYPIKCNRREQDHAVLLVGYGVDPYGTLFWIIKNSWGQNWGEQGYFRLLRGVNACGMGTKYAATAQVA